MKRLLLTVLLISGCASVSAQSGDQEIEIGFNNHNIMMQCTDGNEVFFIKFPQVVIFKKNGDVIYTDTSGKKRVSKKDNTSHEVCKYTMRGVTS